MKTYQISIDLSGSPRTVGVIATPRGLEVALALRRSAVDFLELRLDAFSADSDVLLRAAPKLRAPLIVTVRHRLEGGVSKLTAARRRELFSRFLPRASAIDVELRSVNELARVISEARTGGLPLILSHHDFRRTPGEKHLHKLATLALDAGADILKIATTTLSAADVATLLRFLASETRLPLSVMGMGEFGKVSRLLFAACGSVLNYGFLDTANASGQWPAELLKTRIAEVCTSATLRKILNSAGLSFQPSMPDDSGPA